MEEILKTPFSQNLGEAQKGYPPERECGKRDPPGEKIPKRLKKPFSPKKKGGFFS